MLSARARGIGPRLDDRRQRLAREELHRRGRASRSLVRPKSVTVMMLGCCEAARRLGLALEAARELVLAAELGQQDLDGEIAAHHRVLGAVDGAHAAHADAAHDAVAIADDRADERIDDGRAAARTEGVLELDLPRAARAAGHELRRRGAPASGWLVDATLTARSVLARGAPARAAFATVGASGGRTTATISRRGSSRRRATRATASGVTAASVGGARRYAPRAGRAPRRARARRRRRRGSRGRARRRSRGRRAPARPRRARTGRRRRAPSGGAQRRRRRRRPPPGVLARSKTSAPPSTPDHADASTSETPPSSRASRPSRAAEDLDEHVGGAPLGIAQRQARVPDDDVRLLPGGEREDLGRARRWRAAAAAPRRRRRRAARGASREQRAQRLDDARRRRRRPRRRS